jgi:hypothetical protein
MKKGDWTMKKTLVGIVASTALALSYAPSAEASAYLDINVGGTHATCDNSLAFTATNCGAGFVTVAGPVPLSNDIVFTGSINGVSFGGGVVNGVQLVGNQPGGVPLGEALSTDTKTTVLNLSGSAKTITVSFADNSYTIPVGDPLSFNAAQSLDVIASLVNVTQTFTGYATGTNSLVPATGTASLTPNVTGSPAPPTNTNSSTGPSVIFANPAGIFALSGVESFTLGNNGEVNAQGSITAVNSVPEPGSMLLLGTGLMVLGRKARRRLGKQ